jgi:hypothetical protein
VLHALGLHLHASKLCYYLRTAPFLTYRNVEDSRIIQARVFLKDLVHDAEDVQKQAAAAQQQQKNWRSLVELKARSSKVLAGELDEQLRVITSLSAKLFRAQANIEAARRTLEQCRIARVAPCSA